MGTQSRDVAKDVALKDTTEGGASLGADKVLAITSHFDSSLQVLIQQLRKDLNDSIAHECDGILPGVAEWVSSKESKSVGLVGSAADASSSTDAPAGPPGQDSPPPRQTSACSQDVEIQDAEIQQSLTEMTRELAVSTQTCLHNLQNLNTSVDRVALVFARRSNSQPQSWSR